MHLGEDASFNIRIPRILKRDAPDKNLNLSSCAETGTYVNQLAASGPNQSSIQAFVLGPVHQQVYEAASSPEQPPVQATAVRPKQQVVQVAASGLDEQPV